MSNELKSAAITIKKEIQNLKQYVSDWQDHHDIVLSNLNSASEKAFKDLSKSFLSSSSILSPSANLIFLKYYSKKSSIFQQFTPHFPNTPNHLLFVLQIILF